MQIIVYEKIGTRFFSLVIVRVNCSYVLESRRYKDKFYRHWDFHLEFSKAEL